MAIFRFGGASSGGGGGGAVSSVAGKTGAVTLAASDVGALRTPMGAIASDVLVAVGTNASQYIQAASDAAPNGARLFLAPGTHPQQTVVPKDEQQIVFLPGAIMDGGGTQLYAIRHDGGTQTYRSTYPSRVKILSADPRQRGVVTNYNNPAQTGAIRIGIDTIVQGAWGWTVEDLEVSYNKFIGIRVGINTTVRRCNMHHNGSLGIGGCAQGMRLIENEITDNNYLTVNPAGNEAGGTKFVLGRGMEIRGNYVARNVGPGIWLDEGAYGAVIEHNTVEDNWGAAIAIEISYQALIQHNTTRRNGFQEGVYANGAGVQINSSSGCVIRYHRSENDFAGIILTQQDRTGNSQIYGPMQLRNCVVRSCDVIVGNIPAGRQGTLGSSNGNMQYDNSWRLAMGVYGDYQMTSVFGTGTVKFGGNTVDMSAATSPAIPNYYVYNGAIINAAAWAGYGFDVPGSDFAVDPATPTFLTTTPARGLTAVGVNSGNALALTAQYNVVTSAAAGTGVKLPLVVGAEILVVNRSSGAVLVYPFGGATIEALGQTVGVSLAAGAQGRYLIASSTQIYAV